jgi:fatty-acyl-CoA synthase
VKTIAELVRARADDGHTGLLFEDRAWTYAEYVRECEARAQLLLALKPPGPFHVGVLLENIPDYPFLLGGAALAGATVVGLNPTRRGEELERDLRHADCGILISEDRLAELAEGLDADIPAERRFSVDQPRWREALERAGKEPRPMPRIDAKSPFLLIFTSGTTGDPKAAICSQRRLADWAFGIIARRSVTARDVIYQTMPMLHANAIIASTVALAAGATLALRRRFSASGFLPDVRRFGATMANYVGKPLSFILATREQPDDANNSLRLVYGNEAAIADLAPFARRFGCQVTDAYGSSEGGVTIFRDAETPPSALGRGGPGVAILSAETGRECPVARFDAGGRLLNPEQAVGEIANIDTADSFEGYWKNPEADAERIRDGTYWTGDLGYRDDAGFIYFAGRGFDWMRVDGENLAAAPVEQILARHPDIAMACVYAVPDPVAGDQVMAALVLRDGCSAGDLSLDAFLAEQRDLSSKGAPRFLRIAPALPMTATHKVARRELRRERWECADPVWIRSDEDGFRPLDAADVAALREAFAAHGRSQLLE